MIDLLEIPVEIEVEIAKISNYHGSGLSSACVSSRLVSGPKRCAEIAAKSSSFRERVGA